MVKLRIVGLHGWKTGWNRIRPFFMMIKLPTKKQFESIIKSFPDRFRPAFLEISEGVQIIKAFSDFKIPPITGQWNCYKITNEFFNVPVSPKQLQIIILLRKLVDGEDENELKNSFSSSSVRLAKVIGFDHAIGKNKQITIDLDRIGVHSYRYAKKHNKGAVASSAQISKIAV